MFLDNELLLIRDSHRIILDNILSMELTYFDDLVALPLMAWINYPINLFFGFGVGLMHFYASEFFYLGTWITPERYIEGNFGFITYVSNFGLILYILFFIFMLLRIKTIIRSNINNNLTNFFIYSFIVGFTIQGSMSIPLFLAIGWIIKQSSIKIYRI
jgi:hypothetical protein